MWHFVYEEAFEAIPVAARSKASVCGRSVAAIASSNPAGGMDMSVCCECCVLLGTGPCIGLITRPEESCSECGVCECDQVQ